MSTVRSIRLLPVRGSVSSLNSLQRLGHLVAAFAAADVDDDVGVAPFGQLVLGHGFAGAETAGDGRRAALGEREHRIDGRAGR